MENNLSKYCKNHEEWMRKMCACFEYMLFHFSLNELEKMVENRKKAVNLAINLSKQEQ